MDLSSKEKKALEEKYKEQRRSMWAGKRPSAEACVNELEETKEISENLEETQDTTARDSSGLPETDLILAIPHSLDVVPSRVIEERLGTNPSPTSSPCLEEKLSPLENGLTEVRERRSLEIKTETSKSLQKIRDRREGTWEGNSVIRSRRRQERRKTNSKEPESWNSTNQEKVPRSLTWKFALAVFGAIFVLIGIGILLGYRFAS